MFNINLYLIEYAINSLLRQKSKTFFIFFIFTFLVFLISSVFFISNSIKHELKSTTHKLPTLTIQQLKGGKTTFIETYILDDILTVAGVQSAQARVWGYYFFENAGANFTLMGIDSFENQYSRSLKKLVEDEKNIDTLETEGMLVGQGVKKILDQNFYPNFFNFILPDGSMKKVNISGVFKSDIELQSNDMILVSKSLSREILGIEDHLAVDITVEVANPDEIQTVIQKIQSLYPNLRIVSKEDFLVSYENIFDYKSGVFLVLFIISLFTFFIILYDKISGLSSSEKKEIGILKALGWGVEDILKEKFYEAFTLSFLAYLTGVILSFVFVYILNAPLLRGIFEGYSLLKTTFTLPFVFDFQTLTLVFFITIPIYIAATIIPSWRVATLDADEVIR